VINIHTENLNEITRRLGTKTVEMLILPITNYPTVISEARPNPRANQTNDDTFVGRHIIQKLAFALVTDPRIPREWFHFKPPLNPEKSRQIKAAFPAYFRASE